ncbi:MAG TPA: hypothetical protein VD859_10305 [Nocardioides sp.]|nr:hypothetical protein [Nocardioides sp.]
MISHGKARRRLAALAAAGTTVTAMLAALPAQAGDDTPGDEEVTRSGSCSGSTGWTMTAKGDDGRIEIETEIVSGVSGQKWRWVLRHDDSVSARGKAKTSEPGGSFEVKRKTVDAEGGTDRFKFRAVHRGDGEKCVARVRY